MFKKRERLFSCSPGWFSLPSVDWDGLELLFLFLHLPGVGMEGSATMPGAMEKAVFAANAKPCSDSLSYKN